MTYLTNIYTNITIMSICLIFTVILLTAMLLQRDNVPTTKTLFLLTCVEAVILLGQIVQWILYYMAQSGKGSSFTGMVDAVFFCIDFTLMYLSFVIFYKFLQIYIVDTGKRQGRNIHISNKIFKLFLVLWGIVSLTFIITVAMRITIAYDDSGMLYSVNSNLHILLIRSNLIIHLTCIYYILKYREILGLPYFLILMSYVVVRFVMLPLDLVYNMTFSYMALSVEIFIIYLGMDRRRATDLLSQQIEIARTKVDLEEKNTQIMVSQIQPHFMYNTLSVIDYLCGKDPKLASLAISKFSDYLRTNMKSLGSTTPISFEKELEHTQTYLWIEQLRFPDILEVEYDISVMDFELPPLTLQPLVENAVKHGIRGNEDGGKITISTKIADEDIIITVEDNGIGFDKQIMPDDKELHVGIANVRSRIQTICNGSLEITSTPGVGTLATIRIKK